MQIQIRHDEHVQGDKNGWVTSTVEDALARYREQITTVEVHLADENGPKHTDGDIRATVEVRPAGFNPIAATSHGNDVGTALEAALEKVTRMLDNTLGRVRDHHPR
jgi:ribosome-associated translation inhibitor RaiA